jgi:hypothetical protein
MTTNVAYRAGQRAARARTHGDEAASRALFRDVVWAATYAKDKAHGRALAAAFERGYQEEGV